MVTTKIALFRTIVNKRIFYSVVKFFSTLLGAPDNYLKFQIYTNHIFKI